MFHYSFFIVGDTMTQTQVIEWIIGIILTIVTIHSILSSRAKSKVDNIKTLWDRIEQLEKKLETEISKQDNPEYRKR